MPAVVPICANAIQQDATMEATPSIPATPNPGIIISSAPRRSTPAMIKVTTSAVIYLSVVSHFFNLHRGNLPCG